jgi:hypothetical protein
LFKFETIQQSLFVSSAAEQTKLSETNMERQRKKVLGEKFKFEDLGNHEITKEKLTKVLKIILRSFLGHKCLIVKLSLTF